MVCLQALKKAKLISWRVKFDRSPAGSPVERCSGSKAANELP